MKNEMSLFGGAIGCVLDPVLLEASRLLSNRLRNGGPGLSVEEGGAIEAHVRHMRQRPAGERMRDAFSALNILAAPTDDTAAKGELLREKVAFMARDKVWYQHVDVEDDAQAMAEDAADVFARYFNMGEAPGVQFVRELTTAEAEHELMNGDVTRLYGAPQPIWGSYSVEDDLVRLNVAIDGEESLRGVVGHEVYHAVQGRQDGACDPQSPQGREQEREAKDFENRFLGGDPTLRNELQAIARGGQEPASRGPAPPPVEITNIGGGAFVMWGA